MIMPITVPAHLLEHYDDLHDHFTQVYDALIAPAVERAGLTPIPPSRSGTENIQAGIINDLQGADLVLADLSALNPNVFLELGIRSALDKPVCLVWDGFDKLPFDSGTLHTHQYEPRPLFALNDEIAKMAAHVEATMAKSDGRNELWKFFGSAARLKPAELQPEDATIAAKIDRLAELVESRLPRPWSPQALSLDEARYLVAYVESALESAGGKGMHGTAVQRACEFALGDRYPAFASLGGSLSGRLRSLGLDIRTNDHGQFFLGPQ
ncbi:MAG TPA: hypothetical protein VF519_02040 [Mycobacteriales bacterium]